MSESATSERLDLIDVQPKMKFEGKVTKIELFGAFVDERGQAWVDEFSLDVVGMDIATTNMLTPEEMEEDQGLLRPGFTWKQPVNLGFEQLKDIEVQGDQDGKRGDE